MKIGFTYNPARLAPGTSYQDIVKDIRETAIYCDEMGYDSFWFSEHHFGFWGRTPLPNPVMMGADIAARTKNIRIGFASLIIPFWHPIRLAEDIALLDHFSNGRVDLGMGRGNHHVEAANLNSMANPEDQAENYKVFQETLEVMKRAFSQQYFEFHGEKYNYPAKGSKWDRTIPSDSSEFMDVEAKTFTKLSVIPRPIQKPYPRLWQAVDSSRSIEFAAQQDMRFIMWRPTARRLAEHYKTYLNAARKAGVKPAASGPSVLRDLYVADTMEAAKAEGGPQVMQQLNFTNWRGPEIYTDPGEEIPTDLEAQLRKELSYDWVHHRALLYGTPDYILERLQELRDVANVELVILSCGSLGPDLAKKTLRRFSEEVLPKAKAI
jgi:alkanesulfonate monooxygenase SsuD/methylene tetrahydromethanopterin reductase-like flavin-dependent oxidoreductase (luciferase family)